MQTYSNTNALVSAFINGVDTGAFEKASIIGNDFYFDNAVYAKRAPDGNVLLGKSADVNEEVNDAFVIALAKGDLGFRRVGRFDDLLNANKRLDDLRTGKYDNIKLIASIYDINVEGLDISGLYAEREAIEKKIKENETTLSDRFLTKAREEAKVKADAEMALLEETARVETIKWDAGEIAASNGIVKGAGGLTRLRLITDSRGRRIVQGSSGQAISLNTFVMGLNKVAPRLFGEEKLNHYDQRTYDSGQHVNCGYYRDYFICYNKNGRVDMGCQHSHKDELERFATLHGLALDGTARAS